MINRQRKRRSLTRKKLHRRKNVIISTSYLVRNGIVPAAPVEVQEVPALAVSRKRKASKLKAKWSLSDFEVAPCEGKSRFHDFKISLGLMHGIADLGFHYCTPIQEKALPGIIAGKDMLGRAATGTGKSAAFLIGIFQQLIRQKQNKKEHGRPRALIIAPTRELVIQIARDARDIGKYLPLIVGEAYGGTDYDRQLKSLKNRAVDILVATPGRLLDFSRKGVVNLRQAAIMVIDEADRMLDMGFIPDVRSIIHQVPNRDKRQTLMFSATFTEDVKRLASQWCTDPLSIETETDEVAVGTVKQIVYMTTREEKYLVLYNLLQKISGKVMIFINMKRDVQRLYNRLRKDGVNCTILSGDVPQHKRTKRLEMFRSGQIQVLLATDVAGRGIHIDGISHVINYTLPYEPEDYVHRIGRTGRAGKSGVSISFADEESSFYMMDIEEYIGESLACEQPSADLLEPIPKS